MINEKKNDSFPVLIPEPEKNIPIFPDDKPLSLPVNTGERQVDGKFIKGVCPNPQGRPRGARNKFTETFMKTLTEDFQNNGASALSNLRERDPEVYFRLIISLLPKSLVLQYEESCGSGIDYDNITESEFVNLLNDLQRRKVMQKAVESVSK
ncbi:MAG: hypothetical protein K0R24_631 [Gammaproteobacteria bacterium]|jgi:hypothetical protein|nr:hypothetical protein [Gammaproteobacteria bacterium]